jgi:hypothetical protein
MQIHKFASGGGCAHKIPYNGGLYSLWFDAKGNLTDAEQTVSRNGKRYENGRNVATHGDVWFALEDAARAIHAKL